MIADASMQDAPPQRLFWTPAAWVGGRWRDDVLLEVGADGRWRSVEVNTAPPVQAAAEAVLRAQALFSHAVNGRFKGGYITRHYGVPQRGVHALQLEQCHETYMDEAPPFAYRPEVAARVQPVLRALLEALVEAAA